MLKKKTAIIISDDGVKHILHYYIRRSDDSELFNCTMYNVGIKLDDVASEIEDFSPFLDDAEALFEKLSDNYITPQYLFSVAEDFVSNR